MRKSLLSAVICLASTALFAQQKQIPLDEVVVTANKFDQKASQTGKVVSVITQKELAHQSGRTLGQLLNQQPGLTINGRAGSPGTNQTVYLRGADPKYTLIMINGVPVNDISNINSVFDINLIPVSSIQRIEIMKGGYASLYGSGASAGVINIITKQSGPDHFQSTLKLEGGSFNTFKEQLGFRGHFAKVDYNIQIQNNDTQGFSSAKDSLGNQGFDDDGYHRKAVFANLGIHPGDNWTLRPFIRFTRQKGDLDQAAFSDDKDNIYTTDYFQTGIAIKHTFRNGDLNIKYSYNPTKRHYENDTVDGSSYRLSTYLSKVHYADLYLHYKLDKRVSFLAGNAIRIEKTDQQDEFGSGKTQLSPDSANTEAMSIYGAVFYHAPSGLNLELSGRLHEHKTYGFHPVFSINPSWLINDRVKIFVNVASSYTSPSLYQLYSPYGNTALQPEVGKSYEAGAESWFMDRKVDLSLTAFHRTGKDIIAFGSDYRYINYDKQKATGGEAAVTYRVTDKIKISGWYAYVTGEVTDKDSTYNNLFKRPENSAGLSVGYQVLPNLYLGVDGQYAGDRKDLIFNTTTLAQEVKTLAPYFLLNGYAQYTFRKRYRAYVSLNNVLDEEFVEITGYNTSGFNFNAGVELRLF